jgi:hypothetical protein
MSKDFLFVNEKLVEFNNNLNQLRQLVKFECK